MHISDDGGGKMLYFRYHVDYNSPKTQEPVGLFVAVWHLVQNNVLTKEEVDEYWKMRRYTEEVLPIPPFYADGNKIGAVTWFKDNEKTRKFLEEVGFYFDILRKYNVELILSQTDNPGSIIYEDDFQVGVVRENKAGSGS